jgi:hypothetical protein
MFNIYKIILLCCVSVFDFCYCLVLKRNWKNGFGQLNQNSNIGILFIVEYRGVQSWKDFVQ